MSQFIVVDGALYIYVLGGVSWASGVLLALHACRSRKEAGSLIRRRNSQRGFSRRIYGPLGKREY